MTPSARLYALAHLHPDIAEIAALVRKIERTLDEITEDACEQEQKAMRGGGNVVWLTQRAGVQTC